MLALEDFTTLYSERVADLTTSLIDSGIAAETVASWAEVLERDASDIVSANLIATEATQLTQSL